jgi:hypothetical protein
MTDEYDDKYTRCPDCHRKSVYWKAGRSGEDHYRCRYFSSYKASVRSCGFHFFTSESDSIDKETADRWRRENGWEPRWSIG